MSARKGWASPDLWRPATARDVRAGDVVRLEPGRADGHWLPTAREYRVLDVSGYGDRRILWVRGGDGLALPWDRALLIRLDNPTA